MAQDQVNILVVKLLRQQTSNTVTDSKVWLMITSIFFAVILK